MSSDISRKTRFFGYFTVESVNSRLTGSKSSTRKFPFRIGCTLKNEDPTARFYDNAANTDRRVKVFISH